MKVLLFFVVCLSLVVIVHSVAATYDSDGKAKVDGWTISTGDGEALTLESPSSGTFGVTIKLHKVYEIDNEPNKTDENGPPQGQIRRQNTEKSWSLDKGATVPVDSWARTLDDFFIIEGSVLLDDNATATCSLIGGINKKKVPVQVNTGDGANSNIVLVQPKSLKTDIVCKWATPLVATVDPKIILGVKIEWKVNAGGVVSSLVSGNTDFDVQQLKDDNGKLVGISVVAGDTVMNFTLPGRVVLKDANGTVVGAEGFEVVKGPISVGTSGAAELYVVIPGRIETLDIDPLIFYSDAPRLSHWMDMISFQMGPANRSLR